MNHELKKKAAQAAIALLTCDTSVSVETTLANLEELREDLNDRIEALREQVQ